MTRRSQHHLKNQSKKTFKRNEGFRLSFKEPVQTTFTILQIEEKEVTSKEGEIKFVDISLKGAKLLCNLSLPVSNTVISIEYPLAKEPFFIQGELIWKKDTSEGFIYGIQFLSESYSEETLLQTLKEYVNKNK